MSFHLTHSEIALHVTKWDDNIPNKIDKGLLFLIYQFRNYSVSSLKTREMPNGYCWTLDRDVQIRHWPGGGGEERWWWWLMRCARYGGQNTKISQSLYQARNSEPLGNVTLMPAVCQQLTNIPNKDRRMALCHRNWSSVGDKFKSMAHGKYWHCTEPADFVSNLLSN